MITKKSTVLVADDDPRLLKLIQRNLEIANYRVVTVSDGPSVLRQAEAEEPDLYVLDIMMPGLDGREVTRRLREFSIAPVLMLTAKDTEDDKVAGLEAGADDYLTKPFGAPELIARVKALMRPAYRDEAHLLRVNIARLRQKVEPEPSNPRYVITRPGIGYSLTKLDAY